VLTGTGIPTLVIADRYEAGDLIVELARDYGRPEEEIEEAIRCELPLQTMPLDSYSSRRRTCCCNPSCVYCDSYGADLEAVLPVRAGARVVHRDYGD